jgi:F420-dependent oxidoreductase-like protein
MDLGVVLGNDYYPFHDLVDLAKELDTLGYKQISVPEIWGHDSVSLMSTIAYNTTRIKVSSGIINMYSRTPAVVAMTSATIDEFSNGRFILGLGLSGPKVVENLHGRSFKKPIQHTREFVEVLRSFFGNRRINLQSELLGDLRDFKLSFKPIKPDLPIHIAALGPQNIKLTAEIADGWIPVIMPMEEMKSNISQIHQHLKSNNRDISKFDITPFVLTLLGDTDQVKTALRSHLIYYYGGMGDFYNNMLSRSGYEKEANMIKECFKTQDMKGAMAAISDELLSSICVFGTPDEMRAKLMEFYDIGVTRPLLTIPFNTPMEYAVRTLKVLSSNL